MGPLGKILASALMLIPPIQLPDIQAQVAEIQQAARSTEPPQTAPHVESPPPSLQAQPQAPKPVQATTAPLESQSVRSQILSVFGPAGPRAVSVFWCESKFQASAKNGQFLGIAQMGARERARFGHGPDSLTQIQAAYKYFRLSGWAPWKACL